MAASGPRRKSEAGRADCVSAALSPNGRLGTGEKGMVIYGYAVSAALSPNGRLGAAQDQEQALIIVMCQLL